MDIISSNSEYLSSIVLTGVFFLLMSVEMIFPLRRRKRSWLRRVVINGCLTAVAFIVGTFIVRTVSLSLSNWTSAHGFGMLNVFKLPFAVQFVAGFLLMDLTFYYWHRLNHSVPLLWRFHNVHHIDPDMDVTTSFRFHFVEIFYSTGFRVVQVGLIGVAPLTYVVYEVCFQCGTMFHHSNTRLPLRLERILNMLIVTPRMHGVHHSTVKDETNSNYSVIFRWWDPLHRSLRLGVRQADIDIGVPAYQEAADNRLWNLISLPFRRQREHWRLPGGTITQRDPSERSSQNMLME
jgi:sterol desaturase/sphingolipid hydroxylase (fatty acid hydroxylase superfamily)